MTKEWKERNMTLEGVPLSSAQVMAIRCAVTGMITDLVNDGLGEDEHGKEMTRLYLINLRAVEKILCS